MIIFLTEVFYSVDSGIYTLNSVEELEVRIIDRDNNSEIKKQWLETKERFLESLDDFGYAAFSIYRKNDRRLIATIAATK